MFDPAIEGRWADDDAQLLVERADDRYVATYQDKKDSSELIKYEVHLVDLGGVRLADVIRKDGIVGHFFMRVRVTGGELHLAFMDSDWFRGQVAHEEADVDGGSKQAMLTMSTVELRKMVARFAREPKAYDTHEVVFRRPPVK